MADTILEHEGRISVLEAEIAQANKTLEAVKTDVTAVLRILEQAKGAKTTIGMFVAIASLFGGAGGVLAFLGQIHK